MAGQRALAELKSEFEALTGELVAEGQLSGGDAAAAAAHAASAAVQHQQQQRALPGAHCIHRAMAVTLQSFVCLAQCLL